jgi:hypothetical protein
MAMRKHPPLSRSETASVGGRKVRNIRQSNARNNYTIGTVSQLFLYQNDEDYKRFVALQHVCLNYGNPNQC